MPSTLLVSMPFPALDRPSLGLGLLQAGAERAGFPCDVRYLNLAFADFVGVEEYQWLCDGPSYIALSGEWIFTAGLYGERPATDDAYVEEILRRRCGAGDHDLARLRRARAYVEPFLEHCLAAVDWRAYRVVGFTSTFQQNLASLALARRVKEAHPGVVIAFGGANWEGVMGQELHRRFSFVDVAFSGEADESFPALLASLETGTPLAAIPGIVYRDRSRSVATEPRPVLDLDTLAVPSFDDYFRDLDASASGIDVCPRLMAETARGCWWGAISHCTFCGLNGATMAFRSKSPARVVAELYELHHRHGIDALSVVDNILDMRYFRSVLPALAEGPRLDLFWEVKANLSREQVCTLAAAGVNHVQPGIESMSDHVLGLLGKGTTVFRNVELLKWGREYGIHMDWNLLFGVLGEEPDDYTDQARLFRALTHLEPPSACGPIRFDRFSPYHCSPAAYGITGMRALAAYRYLYEADPEGLGRLAYYFDGDLPPGPDPLAMAMPALAAVEAWRRDHCGGGLWLVPGAGDRLTLLDERGGGPGARRSSPAGKPRSTPPATGPGAGPSSSSSTSWPASTRAWSATFSSGAKMSRSC